MKKQIICGIFFTAFIAGVIAWVFLEQPKVFLATKSPTEIYLVEMAGDKIRPSFPFMNHEVNFNLYRKGQPIVSNTYVYSGDLFDSDFNELYPQHNWINDSVLRFGLDIGKSQKSSDSMIVSNKTNSVIKYLKIMDGDLLFVFGMLPNSTITLPVTRHSYVAAIGEFENRQPIKHKGVNFFGDDPSNPTFKVCLSVGNDSIRIESTTTPGYTSSNSKEPDVPKVENCS